MNFMLSSVSLLILTSASATSNIEAFTVTTTTPRRLKKFTNTYTSNDFNALPIKSDSTSSLHASQVEGTATIATTEYHQGNGKVREAMQKSRGVSVSVEFAYSPTRN